MKVFLCSVLTVFGTSSALANSLVCKHPTLGVELTMDTNEEDMTKFAKLKDTRVWSEVVSFKMDHWGLEGWEYSHAHKTANNDMVLLDARYAFTFEDANVTYIKFDCSGSQDGGACVRTVEKLSLPCSEF